MTVNVSNGLATFAAKSTEDGGEHVMHKNLDNGQGAHDAAISGKPVRAGWRAITAWFTGVANGDTADAVCDAIGRLVNLPFAPPEVTWQYAAAASGITNTTAVTIKAAAAAGIRNYITSIQVQNQGGTGTEVAIRDGAAGPVIWRGFIDGDLIGGGPRDIVFPVPLKGSAATLLEVVCLTTATVTYFNAQGYEAP